MKPVDKLPIVSEAVKGILIRGRVYSANGGFEGNNRDLVHGFLSEATVEKNILFKEDLAVGDSCYSQASRYIITEKSIYAAYESPEIEYSAYL